MDAALQYLISALDAGIEGAITYLQKGFRKKNGVWVKRGLFGKVPAPEKLPDSTEPQVCKGGCTNFCTYANMSKAKEIFNSDDFCYCELMEQKVFKKDKCPFYKDALGNMLNAFTNEK